MKEGNITQIKDFLSSRDVESILGIGKDSLNRYCSDGKITYSKPNNGKRIFRRTEVERFLDKNTYKSKDNIIQLAEDNTKHLVLNKEDAAEG